MTNTTVTEGTGEYVVLHKHVVRQMAEESRELADEVAVLKAELQLVSEERDDLRRRVQAVQAIWQAAPKRRWRRPPTTEGS